MTTKEEVTQNLNNVLVPGVMRSLSKMNLVRDVRVADSRVEITLSSAALAPEIQEQLRDRC